MQCNVCREAFNPNIPTKVPFVLNCGHSICTLCLQTLQFNQCPICHSQIQSKTKNYSLIEMIEAETTTRQETYRPKHRVSRKQDIQKLFKVSLVGASSVGKTTIMNYISKGEFKVDTIPTIGVDFLYIDREFQDKIYRIQLWDTAGQQQYRSIAKSHYINSDVILLVYSLNQLSSFVQLQQYWINQIKEVAPDSQIFLIGNKSDLHRNVPIDRIVNFANKINAMHFQVSCKNDERVLMSWQKVVKYLFSQKRNSKMRKNIKIQKRQRQQNKGFLAGLRECWDFLFK